MNSALLHIALACERLQDPHHLQMQFDTLDAMGFDPVAPVPDSTSSISFFESICLNRSTNALFLPFIVQRYGSRIVEHPFKHHPLVHLIEQQNLAVLQPILKLFDVTAPLALPPRSVRSELFSPQPSLHQMYFSYMRLQNGISAEHFKIALDLLQRPLSHLSPSAQNTHISATLLSCATLSNADTKKQRTQLDTFFKKVQPVIRTLTQPLYQQTKNHLTLPLYQTPLDATMNSDGTYPLEPMPLLKRFGITLPAIHSVHKEVSISAANVYLMDLLLHLSDHHETLNPVALATNPNAPVHTLFTSAPNAPAPLNGFNALTICALSAVLDTQNYDPKYAAHLEDNSRYAASVLQPHLQQLLNDPVETLNVSEIFDFSASYALFNSDKKHTGIFEALSFGFCHQHPLCQQLLPDLIKLTEQPGFDPQRQKAIFLQIQQGIGAAFEYIHPLDLADPYYLQLNQIKEPPLFMPFGSNGAVGQNHTLFTQQVSQLLTVCPALCNEALFEPILQRLFDAQDPDTQPNHLHHTPLHDFYDLFAPVWLSTLHQLVTQHVPNPQNLVMQIQDVFYETCTHGEHSPISALIHLMDHSTPNGLPLLKNYYTHHAKMCALFEPEDAQSLAHQQHLLCAKELSFKLAPQAADKHLAFLDSIYQQVFLQQQTPQAKPALALATVRL